METKVKDDVKIDSEENPVFGVHVNLLDRTKQY